MDLQTEQGGDHDRTQTAGPGAGHAAVEAL